MSYYDKGMPVFFPARRPYFGIPDFCRVMPVTEKVFAALYFHAVK